VTTAGKSLPLAGKALALLVTVSIFMAGTSLVVLRAYSPYPGGYDLFAKVSQLAPSVAPGDAVEYQGVPIGSVVGENLVGAGRWARLEMRIRRGFDISTTATASIIPRSLFGDYYVAIENPGPLRAPYLRPGATLVSAGLEPGVSELVAQLDRIVSQVNPSYLGQVVSDLAGLDAGAQVKLSLQQGARLAALAQATLADQITLVTGVDRLQAELPGYGHQLVGAADEVNDFVPGLVHVQGEYDRLLASLGPLSADLADLVKDYRPTLSQLLAAGWNVSEALIANSSDIQSFLVGLYRYLLKFASISSLASHQVLPSGRGFTYFRDFVTESQVKGLVCSLLDPPDLPANVAAALVPLRQLLSGDLSCPPVSLADFGAPARPRSVPAKAIPAPPGRPSGYVGTVEVAPPRVEGVAGLVEQLLSPVITVAQEPRLPR
jgi:virulence factor Mce-like protein